MRTKYFITIMLAVFSLTSCTAYYRVTSRIESDGSMYREVYAQGDSAFIAGDKTHNPFLFQLDSRWKITHLDSTLKFDFWGEKEGLNVKACQNIPAIDEEYFSTAKGKEHMCSLAIPTERLKKSFRWFYTYYIYTATYHELPDKGPVPLSNYLTEEEQSIWLCGDNTAFNGMNGIEMNDKLDKLEAKFGEWYNRSLYEINYEVLRHFVLQEGDTARLRRLENLKDSIYKTQAPGRANGKEDVELEEFCNLLDKACETNYYSELYKTNKEAMNLLYEKKINVAEVFYHAIQSELTLPGRLLSSNANTHKGNLAIWKIDGFRLLAGDYVLTAESRVTNYWAFGITLLFILLLLGSFIRSYKRRL